MLEYIKPYLARYWRKALLFVLLSVVSMLASTLVPYFNGRFLDHISFKSQAEMVIRSACIVIAFNIVIILLSYVLQIYTAKFKTHVSYDMVSDLIEKAQKTEFLKIQKFEPAYLSARITGDIDTILSFILNNSISVILSPAIATISFCFLFWANKVMFLTAIICIPFYIGLYFLFKKPLKNTRKEYIEIHNKFTGVITEQLSLIEEIKTDGTYKQSNSRLKTTFSSVFLYYIRALRIGTIFTSLDSAITLFFQGFNMIYGGVLVARGDLTIGQYTIINVYFSYIIEKMKYFMSLGQSYQEANVSMERIQEIRNLEKEQNGSIVLENIDKIDVRDLSFKYSDDGEKIAIDKGPLQFRRGHFYGIAGDNGCGKTTFINILLSILQCNVSGEILYNSTTISDIDMYEAKQKLISVVKQNPRFPNLPLHQLLASDDDISCVRNTYCSVIRKWNLRELFYNEQFNLDASLEKVPTELSGGERQKIAILIALQKEPDVLILDEPTSAMDQKSISVFIQFLNSYKEKHMVLCISHEERVLKNADMVIDINRATSNKIQQI